MLLILLFALIHVRTNKGTRLVSILTKLSDGLIMLMNLVNFNCIRITSKRNIKINNFKHLMRIIQNNRNINDLMCFVKRTVDV